MIVKGTYFCKPRTNTLADLCVTLLKQSFYFSYKKNIEKLADLLSL